MFVIVHKDRVVAGPTAWNRPFYKAMLERQDINVEVPGAEPVEFPVILDEDTKAYRAVLEYPTHNPKIEYLHGPFWTFNGDTATGTHQIMQTPIELVKNSLKERVAAVRYSKENAGTKAIIKNTEVSLDTSRQGKLVYSEKLAQMTDSSSVNFKFRECWLNLTKSDLETVVNTINSYVQSTFDEEYKKSQDIDAATTSAQLDAIVIGDEPKTSV